MKIKNSLTNLSRFEAFLWLFSALVISLSFILSGSRDYLSLIASLIGISALIFTAKGDVLGQVLIVIFSLFYGFISFSFGYYGEMITYLGMTTPIAIMSIISWHKNPFEKGGTEVKVNKIRYKEIFFMLIITALVTFAFYFILDFFNTTNLAISTVSIATSFMASYLTFRRSSFYALAYALNDVVLVVLWVLASLGDSSYVPMAICFIMFLLSDLYGFFNWKRMRKKQIEKLLSDTI